MYKTQAETRAFFRAFLPMVAGANHCDIIVAPPFTAIAAAVELSGDRRFPIPPASLEEGIRRTYWPGRLERIATETVEWILDVAHNPAGAWALRAGLRHVLRDEDARTLVFSCLRDKPLDELAQILFPLFDEVIVAPLHTARAAALDDLLAAAETTGTPTVATESVRDALRLAEERSAGGVAVVSGSVYLVGEARSILRARRGKA